MSMPRVLVALALTLLLAACSAFSTPPKLPEPPVGAEQLAGDGAWESSYDLAVIAWREHYERYRSFDSKDYWLTEPMTPEQVFARYAPALGGWTVTDNVDTRNRWIGRSWERDGRLVAIAIFPATRHGMPHDALNVVLGPR